MELEQLVVDPTCLKRYDLKRCLKVFFLLSNFMKLEPEILLSGSVVLNGCKLVKQAHGNWFKLV